MSCIVSVKDEKNGVVYMGGDSCTTSSGVTMSSAKRKVISISDSRTKTKMLIGCVGNVLIRNCIERILALEKKYCKSEPNNKLWDGLNEDSYIAVSSLLVPRIRDAFTAEGIFDKFDSDYKHFDGNIMIAVKGRIFVISEDFSIVEPSTPFWSIGAGRKVALGSLYESNSTLNQELLVTSALRVISALSASESFIPSVKSPFFIDDTVYK